MTKKKAIDQKWTAHSPSQIPNNIKVYKVCVCNNTNSHTELLPKDKTWIKHNKMNNIPKNGDPKQQVNSSMWFIWYGKTIQKNVKNSMSFPWVSLASAQVRSTSVSSHQHPWDQENEIIDMYGMVRGYVICMIYIYIYIYTKIWNDPLRGYVMVEEHLLTVKSLNIDFWWLLTTLGRSSCATSPLTNTIDRVQHSAEKLLINGEHRNLKVEEHIYMGKSLK